MIRDNSAAVNVSSGDKASSSLAGQQIQSVGQ